MTESKQIPAQEHPLARRLRQAKITKFVIIDDAYDVPTKDILVSGEIDDFWDMVERDSEMLKELQDFKPNIRDAEDIDDEVIKNLWNAREKLTKLDKPCTRCLFPNRLQMRNDVNVIVENLLNLGLEPIRVGSEDELPEHNVRLIFLDYVLNPTAQGDQGEIATGKAKEIYDKFEKDAEKPFIILMSDKPNAMSQQEAFRKKSGLLKGLFGFIPKADLLNQEKLYINLETWAVDMPARHNIQRFVEALERSVVDASKTFIGKMRDLSFEDYANIQWLSLQQDGQPLGDYMLWLYKSYLAYLIHDNDKVLIEQKRLDKLSFDKFFPSQNPPSAELAEIYRFALTEPGVGELETHPRSDPSLKEPLLQLGDIFIKKGTHEVLMVISPACDLMFAPETKRDFPQELSIFLIPGNLQPIDKNPEHNLMRTELFYHDNQLFRILWDNKNVVSKKYKDIWAWFETEKYLRIARLRIHFALEIQQAFAANLTRVGSPVKPPFWRTADVEVYCQCGVQMCRMIGQPIQCGASIVNRKIGTGDRHEDYFSLSLDCIFQIKERLDIAVKMIEKEIIPIPSGEQQEEKKGQRLKGKIRKIKRLKESNEVLLPLKNTLHKLPLPNKSIKIDSELLWVYRDGDLEGEYKANSPISINIKYSDNPLDLESSRENTSKLSEEGPISTPSYSERQKEAIIEKCLEYIDKIVICTKKLFRSLIFCLC